LLVPDPRARNRTLIRLAIILALAAGLYLFSRHKFRALKNGEFRKPAPDFSLTDLSGRRLSLSEYKGKVVLLNFWATWCDPCRQEIPRFVELQNKYGERGLQVVGVSLDDDAKAVPPFYRQYKMNYPVAVGDAKLAERFGDILGLPVNLLIDRDGRIAARHVGEANIPQVETEIRSLLQTPQAPQGGG
jgi:cytochrome c biogenesis protein CcmG/thiol:disulfide interchange protein DsbE